MSALRATVQVRDTNATHAARDQHIKCCRDLQVLLFHSMDGAVLFHLGESQHCQLSCFPVLSSLLKGDWIEILLKLPCLCFKASPRGWS